jgi:phosphotransferase system HPr-like phosphotransfer protein
MRVKLNLDTMKKVNEFVKVATTVQSDVFLTNDNHQFVVNAKSMIAALYSLEWSDGIWLECADNNAYSLFRQFMED